MLPEHGGRHQRADPPRYICPTERWHKGRRKAASMKFTINIDCTPEEARAYLGLPDVRPMQEQLLKEMQDVCRIRHRTSRLQRLREQGYGHDRWPGIATMDANAAREVFTAAHEEYSRAQKAGAPGPYRSVGFGGDLLAGGGRARGKLRTARDRRLGSARVASINHLSRSVAQRDLGHARGQDANMPRQSSLDRSAGGMCQFDPIPFGCAVRDRGYSPLQVDLDRPRCGRVDET